MAQGLERRAQPVDNLRGQEAVNPVTRSVPQMGSVPTPRVPEATFGQQIAEQVSRFAGERLQQIQSKRQERSMMDGQIAAMQGASFESVEMEGDKWALEGWRVVSAQTMASGLLRAQEAEIGAGAYEQDPDTYRQTLVGRIDAMTADIPDARTRQLARDNLMEQMPTLVDAHMRQNISFREQQNFDALAGSVDTLSRDNGATGILIAFATGESEATAGLSIERRRAAVVQGVVNAFTNNNPAAFAHLEAAGFLTTDNLTASQLQTIRTAQRQYEARFKESVNVEHLEAVSKLDEKVASGDINALQAVEEIAKINARYGLRTGAIEAGQIYDRARAGVEFAEGTRGLNIAAAGANRNFGLQARLLEGAVIHQESRNNPNAVSPVGATGLMQVMPGTAHNPGIPGIRNVFELADSMGIEYDGRTVNHAEQLLFNEDLNKAMGREYLTGMLRMFDGNVELALAAYNAGPGAVKKYGGIPPFKETQDYVKNIMAAISDNRPDPEGERAAAEQNLEAARDRAKISTLEAITPELARIDTMFSEGVAGYTQEQWLTDRASLYEQYDVELTEGRLNEERGIMRSRIADSIKTMEEVNGREAAVELTSLLAAAEETRDLRLEQFRDGLAPDGVTEESIWSAYHSSVMDSIETSGAPIDMGVVNSAVDETVRGTIRAVAAADAHARNLAVLNNAETSGTLSTAPKHIQEMGLKRNAQEIAQQSQNFRAENPDIPEAIVGAMERQARVEYVTRNGIVDTEVQQMVNLAASGQAWIGPDGQPNPSTVVGLHTFTSILSENQDLAYQYVPDPEARGRMMAAAFMVQTRFPDRDVFTDVDLSNRDDPVANAFHTAVHQVGLSMASPPSPEETEARVGRALEALEAGNVTNTFMGGFWNDDVADAILPTGNFATINRLLGRGTSDWDDVNVSGRIDRQAINDQFKGHVERFLTEIVPHMPGTSRDGAVTMAMDYVRERGAMMGSSYVMPPPNEPGLRAQMFPGQQVENLAAVNTAIGQWMANPEVQERNPILADVPNSIFWRGTPQYTVTRLNGQYVATIPGHGSIVLPLREIGDLYTSNR